MNATQGCPQGRVFSLLMGSMVVCELLRKLTNTEIQAQGYADGIVLICQDQYEGTLCDRIQAGLQITCTWCRKSELRINPAKANIVTFNKKHKRDDLRPIRLQGLEMKRVTEVKYLRIKLYQKLLSKRHVENEDPLEGKNRDTPQKWYTRYIYTDDSL